MTTQLEDAHRAAADAIRPKIRRDVNVAPFPYSSEKVPRIEVWPSEEYLDYYGESDSDLGLQRVNLRYRIDIATKDAETAFLIMADLLAWEGPSSIRAAVMSDRTLGGRVDDAVVMSAEWATDEESQAQTAWLPFAVWITKERS